MIILEHLIQSTKTWAIMVSAMAMINLNCTSPNNNDQAPIANGQHVLASLLTYEASKGTVSFKGKPFDGYAVKFNSKNIFTFKEEYVNGKKSGESLKWFDNGQLSYEGNYKNGKLHGTSNSWWKTGNKRSTTLTVDGIGQGYQLQWYRSGALFKRIKLKDGKEEGLQQSWRENGKLYNNYEVKNGRIFGLKRSKLCFQLDNEEVKFTNEFNNIDTTKSNIPKPLIFE